MTRQKRCTVDLGFAQWKIATSTAEVICPAGFVQLDWAEYENILQNAGGQPGPDVLVINGTPYAVGATAESKGIKARRRGAQRYSRDYIGVAAAAMLARAYPHSSDPITLMVAHPPDASLYRDALIAAVKGTWHVATNGHERTYNVRTVATYPEALGGLMNQVLNEQGQQYQHPAIPLDGYGLLIDIGGHTVGVLATQPGGRPDFATLAHSIEIGIDDALQSFAGLLRQSYSDQFRTLRDFRPDRLRQALASGQYRTGGQTWECHNEARAATSQLLNKIADVVYDLAGGPLRWDYHLMSGGGGGLLFDRVVSEVLEDHLAVYPADDLEHIDRANLRGGAKVLAALGE